MTDRSANAPEPSAEALECAARWFVRLDDPAATPDTFADWNKWLKASREHRRAFEEIENTVLRLQNLPQPPPLPSPQEIAADEYDGAMPILQFIAARRRSGFSTSPRPRGVRRLAVAAALLAIGFGGIMFWMQRLSPPPTESLTYSTAPGEKAHIRLPDGSRVTLDADSALSVHLTPTRRALRLTRGEVYFEVAQDRTRPFVVQAGATEVTALGTAFNVRRSENRTVVAVVEGKVEVVAGAASGATPVAPEPPAPNDIKRVTRVSPPSIARLSAQVSAGEAVSYVDDGDFHALQAVEAALATGWLEGRRRYRNEPLRYVLADVARYNGRPIEVADEATGALQFTGTLSLENSAGWLKGLSVALPVRLTEGADGTLRVEHR